MRQISLAASTLMNAADIRSLKKHWKFKGAGPAWSGLKGFEEIQIELN